LLEILHPARAWATARRQYEFTSTRSQGPMQFQGFDLPRYYYCVKPFIPRRVQLLMRRWVAARKRRCSENIWPIDWSAATAPTGWQGWPDGKQFALVLTHDVDTLRGQAKCEQLMRLDKDLGFRSSFNFVANGYRVSDELRRDLRANGFEVGIHGLVHNRKLFASRETFQRQAHQINDYLKAWEAVGFRAPCMYHNLEWFHELHITYDASTFDTDPFEPQPDGVGTIFPFTVSSDSGRNGYVELPYTLPQDFTLFIILREKDISVWKEKLSWIANTGGMALLNAHPDYMNFNGKPGYEEYPSRYYEEFLHHVAKEYKGKYWHSLPSEMAAFWSSLQTLNGDEATGTFPGS
jgi:hypothetical protein